MQYAHLRRIKATFGVPRTITVGSQTYKGNWHWPYQFFPLYLTVELHRRLQARGKSWPLPEDHPIARWLTEFPEIEQVVEKSPGIEGMVQLGYNLFISRNQGLDDVAIVDRLLAPQNFFGAAYELHARARFLLDGYRLQLENEADNSTTHCEFSAFHDASGLAFSVEAKTTTRGGILGGAGNDISLDEFKVNVKHKLHDALKKTAAHPRVVFVELHMPPMVPTGRKDTGFLAYSSPHREPWLEALDAQVNELRVSGIKGQPAPPALLCFTNMPAHLAKGDIETMTLVRSLNFPGWDHVPIKGERRSGSRIERRLEPLFHVAHMAGRRPDVPSYFNPIEGLPGDEDPAFHREYREIIDKRRRAAAGEEFLPPWMDSWPEFDGVDGP